MGSGKEEEVGWLEERLNAEEWWEEVGRRGGLSAEEALGVALGVWVGLAAAIGGLFYLGYRRRHSLGGLGILSGRGTGLPLPDVQEPDMEARRDTVHKALAKWTLREWGPAEPEPLLHYPAPPAVEPPPARPDRRVRFLRDAVSFNVEPLGDKAAAAQFSAPQKEAPTDPLLTDKDQTTAKDSTMTA